MRSAEASYLVNVLFPQIPPTAITWMNLGSSSRAHAEQRPHVLELLNALAQRGVRLVNVDLVADDSVDITGNLFDQETQDQIRTINPQVIMVNNILEHVDEPDLLARVVEELTPTGGWIIATVPQSFPYHLDPIDTLYRPHVKDITQLFPLSQLIEGSEVEAGSFLQLREATPSFWRKIKAYRRVLLPAHPRRSLPYHIENRLWVGRPYIVSCVLMQKIA